MFLKYELNSPILTNGVKVIVISVCVCVCVMLCMCAIRAHLCEVISQAPNQYFVQIIYLMGVYSPNLKNRKLDTNLKILELDLTGTDLSFVKQERTLQ